MGRNEQLVRQLRIWRLLSQSRALLTADEIARRLSPDECTSRTVRRALEVLESLNVPLHRQREGRTWRYAIRDNGPGLILDDDLGLVLHLALGLLQPLEDTLLGQRLQELIRVLESRLSAQAIAHFGRLAERVLVKLPATPAYVSDSAIPVLNKALREGRWVRMRYRTLKGERSERDVVPQGMFYGPRGLYFVGSDRTRDGAVRTFRCERIESCTLGSRAEAAGTLDLDSYTSGAIGIHSAEHEPRRFVIRLFSHEVATLLRENPWHESQEISEEPGGTWRMALMLTTSRELVSRTLALGLAAEVLEPESLRAELAAIVREMAARYPRVGSSRSRSDQQEE